MNNQCLLTVVAWAHRLSMHWSSGIEVLIFHLIRDNSNKHRMSSLSRKGSKSSFLWCSGASHDAEQAVLEHEPRMNHVHMITASMHHKDMREWTWLFLSYGQRVLCCVSTGFHECCLLWRMLPSFIKYDRYIQCRGRQLMVVGSNKVDDWPVCRHFTASFTVPLWHCLTDPKGSDDCEYTRHTLRAYDIKLGPQIKWVKLLCLYFSLVLNTMTMVSTKYCDFMVMIISLSRHSIQSHSHSLSNGNVICI